MIQTALANLGSIGSLSQVLFFLPLSLDVAGKDCFLTLSAVLSLYYFCSATVYLIVRNTRFWFISQLFTLTQLVAIPTMLLVCLNLFTSDVLSLKATTGPIWTALRALPHWWEVILTYSTPVFVLLEGLSTLLCIQSGGQLSRFVVERRDESFSLLFLIGAAATYVVSGYFLYQSYTFAANERISATLIGVSLTTVLFLSGIAFALRKGSPVETSLMMAYVVYNVYWLSSENADPVSFFSSFKSDAAVPLPPVIVQSATALMDFVKDTLGAGLDFLLACSAALPLPVIVNLLYRILVLYAALKIIVAIKRVNSGFDESTPLSEEGGMVRFVTILISYSRLILIAVYTHLLFLNNEGHHVFWRWTNVFVTLTLWGVELLIGREDGDQDTLVTGLRLKDD